MNCPAYRTIPTGLMASEIIGCAKPEGHKGSHRSGWIVGNRINELTQTKKVRVEWFDA